MSETTPSALADAYRRKAELHIALDEPAAALETFRKALALEPSSADTIARSGELQENLGLREEALASLRRAAALEPRSAALRRRIARVLADLREFDAQARELERAIALEPRDAGALLDLARLRLWRKELPSATALARRAVAEATDPEFEARARRVLGAAAALAGRRSEARRELDAALRLAPGDAESWVWSAELHRRAGDPRAALSDLRKADGLGYHALGSLINRFLAGLAATGRGPAPGDPDFAYIMSTVPPALIDLRDEGARSDPRRLRARLEKALAWLGGNRSLVQTFLVGSKKSRRLVNHVNYFPRDRLVFLQSTIHYGDYERVLSLFDRLIRREPREAYPYSHRAEVYLWVGRYDDARRDFARARRLNPKLLWPWVGAAACSMLLGDCARALRELDETKGRGSPSILCNWRGESYRRLGEPGRALRELARIPEKFPFRPAVWINTALAQGDLGDERAQTEMPRRLRRHMPEFILDAAREAGVRAPDSPDGSWTAEGARRTLESALALMRGNRSSWMYGYVLDGRYKVIRLRGTSPELVPANLHGFAWALDPEA